MDIRITENGLVSFEETKILKQVQFKDFIENLKDIKPLSTGFIPNGCILYSKRGDISTYVVEEKPKIQILNWNSFANFGVVPYPISMPFIYWIYSINGNYINRVLVRASKKPVRSLGETLLNAAIPNFHSLGISGLCRGDIKLTIDKSIKDTMWNSNWNGDLGISFPYGITSYKDWANRTVKNPLLWMDLDFLSSNDTFEKILNE